MAFFWRKQERIVLDKVQLVFKETGFHFTIAELEQFLKLAKDACRKNDSCSGCSIKEQCHQFLLKTPVSQIDLAVSMHELERIQDLVEGALFKAGMHRHIFGTGRN